MIVISAQKLAFIICDKQYMVYSSLFDSKFLQYAQILSALQYDIEMSFAVVEKYKAGRVETEQ